MELLLTDDFQVFIKPVGARCNLNCSYCYYSIHETDKISVMDDETLENCIIQHFATSTSSAVFFTWHGGEPLLAGIDFYEKVIAMQKKHLPRGKSFLNGIQTNGTLITKAWCEFFAINGFVIGISIDGPNAYHDAMRLTHNKRGSFDKTLIGYRLLSDYNINPEILCVVSSCNVHHPLAVYDFFKTLGAQFITFLPLVEKAGHGAVSQASVPALAFGHFLSAIFDQWNKTDIGAIKIQIFEEALRTAFHQEHTLCIFKKRCGGVPIIESNGDFYPCDHFVGENRSFGNINKHPLAYLLNHPKQKAFGDAKFDTLPQYCIRCEVREMCNGECPKNRFITSPEGEPKLNYLCEGYRYFFNHCKPFIEAVSKAWG